MLLGIEHFMVDAVLLLELAAQVFTLLDAGGADKHWSSRIVEALDLIDNRIPLVLLAQEDQVIAITTDNRFVGGDAHHAKFVDLMELGGFGVSGTGHSGEALVQLEEVLDGDGGHRLRLFLDRDAFLRFHCLMQAI